MYMHFATAFLHFRTAAVISHVALLLSHCDRSVVRMKGSMMLVSHTSSSTGSSSLATLKTPGNIVRTVLQRYSGVVPYQINSRSSAGFSSDSQLD